MRYVIGEETWLHDFGGRAISYLSGIYFERISAGYTTGALLSYIDILLYSVLVLYLF